MSISFDLTVKDGWLLNWLTYYSETQFKEVCIKSGDLVINTWQHFMMEYLAEQDRGVTNNRKFLPLYFSTGFNDIDNNTSVSAAMSTSRLLANYRSRKLTKGLQIEFIYADATVPDDVIVFANIVKTDKNGVITAETLTLNKI